MTMTVDMRPPDAPDVPRDDPPRWVRAALVGLLAATAVLYLWGLGSSGWANQYYAAAVQAGTQNATAWLFGSLDPGNAITVDKPPAALWVMVLFGRLFGFSAFTMLLPQALMGVATVSVLFATVRRIGGPVAGLIAGAAMAVTPVAALMFRFNNPDALLVLLLVVAAYFAVRAIETGGTRWMILVGCVIGFAFLTKMLQAFLVVPGLALAFLVAAPVGVWRRLGALAAGGLAMVVSAGWYLLLVELWPASSRPYIGGSTGNSLLQLALGYNGIERIAGRGPDAGGPGGGGPGGGPGGGANLFFGGEPGIGRLFGMSMGVEASWLLPAALIGVFAGLWFTRRAARTSTVRAGLLLWGGWLLVTGAVFSFMDGTIHPYYTVALAPAVAALVGISVAQLWRGRGVLAVRVALAAMAAATGVWAFVLLDRTPEWQPWLRWVVLVVSVGTAAVLSVGAHRLGRATAAVVLAAVLAGLAAPAAFAVYNVAHPASGPGSTSGPAGAAGAGAMPGGPGGHRRGVETDDPALQALIGSADNRWAAATIGSMGAAGLQLDTGASVMAIGGFTGSDDSPTLAQFQQYVADHEVRYFIAGERFGPPGAAHDGAASDITAWVTQRFTPIQVGGQTVYDLQHSR
ncbi:glycosyltransferase family 39 protein [Mycolicibacterium sp. S2-37]|uniref:ArnT family glycosyltransferase n=1 Tax=Mycolicibacterium sp. S2-37 TaxID=2810297 RepID=UPI001A950ECB|nr:glycosyltransferase family 39 protein [Mycolicibacterium sp. S2-37]MBO0679705.1 glycosyltransferase family 39 protein [Mycolicibacterium sp. S2-37]